MDFLLKAGKVIIAGGIAFITLTIFCIFYYNAPVHYFCADGATDYVWEPNAFYSRGTEGFAWGKTNNEGYNNIFDYDESISIDILVMGSSHMEAYQVAVEDSTAGMLNAMLEELTVYNIGISGHDFLVCADNFSAAAGKYHPSQYIIIETSSVRFSDEELSSVINGTVSDIPSHSDGIIGLLQKNPFLRLLYGQIKAFLNQAKPEDALAEREKEPVDSVTNQVLLSELLQKMSETTKEVGAELVIVYHPGISYIDMDGSIVLKGNLSDVQQFAECCNINGIFFIDMSDRFLKEYADNYVLPYGFSNTSVGSGHLNKYGHAMVAEEIYIMIKGEK